MVIAVKIITAKNFSAARALLRDLMRTAIPVGSFPDATPQREGRSPMMRAVCNSAYEPIRADRKLVRQFRCTAARSLPRPRPAGRLC